MTTTNKTDDTKCSNDASPAQSKSLLLKLPADIILEIFSYLNQQEALICMTVCHEWCNDVPELTQDVWRELRVNTSLLTSNRCLEKCLGRHVKSLVLEPIRGGSQTKRVEQYELDLLLQRVIDRGCTEIESIELISCVTTQLDRFLKLLQELTPRVTSLRLRKHISSIEPLRILYALPRLTHFTCSYYSIVERNFVASELEIPDDYLSTVTHLFLDTQMSKDEKELILKRCPHLRYFRDTSGGIGTFGMIDLDPLFTWCPNISVLESKPKTRSESPDTYINEQSGLRLLNIASGHGIDKIARLLATHQDTLEFLSLWRNLQNDDWSHVFESLRAPKLRTLISHENLFNARALAILINHCPILETLDLYLPRHLVIGESTIFSISKMRQLKNVILGGIALDDGLSLLTLLERFPALEKLVLHRMPLSVKLPEFFESPRQLKHLELPEALWKDEGINEVERDAAIGNFLKHLTGNSKLETIHLPHVPMLGNKSLLAIAMIPTLKSLEIQVDRVVQDAGLLEFVKRLRNTTIATLTLCYIGPLSLAVLETLAEVPFLRTFCMGRVIHSKAITHVNKRGLQQLLRKSPRLRKLLFQNYTVFEDIGSLSTHSQLRKWVKSQEVDPDAVRFRRGHWDMNLDTFNNSITETVLREVVITRLCT